MPAIKYIILTPVRNEEAIIGKTISSVTAQTVLPAEWIIINDGSTDGTPAILDAASAKYSWIQVIHRPDRGFRKPGTGVMEAVFEGLANIKSKDWDYLVKLDGDLSFDANYFADCFRRFDSTPKLGIGGGVICTDINGKSEEEAKGDPKFHVRGATKIYRRACWDAIGGLIKSTGWDTLDEVKANMLGWDTYSFKDLSLMQLKPTGSADGTWNNWYKNGRANYIVGYHPLFMVAKCLKYLFASPICKISIALFFGYASGYIQRIPRPCERDVIRYLRQQQIRALTLRSSFWS